MAVVGVCAVPSLASPGWSGFGAGGATAHREAILRLWQKPGPGGAGQGTGVLLARPVAAEHSFRGTRTALTLYWLCAIFAIPVQPALACWASTLVTARSVDANKAATSPVDAALIHIPTVGDTIQHIAMMAEALEASRCVDTYVVTGSIKGTLIYILAVSLINKKLIALLAAAFEAAHRVAANVITAPIVQAALIYVFAGLPVWLQHEAHRAAAVDTRRCIVALTVAASVVNSTGLDARLPISVEHKLDMAAAPGTLLCVIARVLAATVTIVARQFTVPLVLGELKARTAFTGNTPFGCLPANVSTAMVLVHAIHSFFWPLDACVLIVAEEEAFPAVALIAAHHVDTALLTAAVALSTLVHIQTVVSIMCQVESIIAGASVIARDVDTVMHTTCIILSFTLIHIFAMFTIPCIARLADALV